MSPDTRTHTKRVEAERHCRRRAIMAPETVQAKLCLGFQVRVHKKIMKSLKFCPLRSRAVGRCVGAWFSRFLPRSSVWLDVIREEAWPFYRTSSGVRLCWVSKNLKDLKVDANLSGVNATQHCLDRLLNTECISQDSPFCLTQSANRSKFSQIKKALVLHWSRVTISSLQGYLAETTTPFPLPRIARGP